MPPERFPDILNAMEESPRKQKRPFNAPGHAHFVTFSCHHRWPLLSKNTTRKWVIDSLNAARLKHRMDLYAYVIMPEHVHVLVNPREDVYEIGTFLADVKRPVSWNARQFLLQSGNTDWIDRLTVTEDSQTVFRFWQAGGGFDRNICYESSLSPVAEYIHDNPVRRGLVDDPVDWRWSSAAFWMGKEDVPLVMDPLP